MIPIEKLDLYGLSPRMVNTLKSSYCNHGVTQMQFLTVESVWDVLSRGLGEGDFFDLYNKCNIGDGTIKSLEDAIRDLIYHKKSDLITEAERISFLRFIDIRTEAYYGPIRKRRAKWQAILDYPWLHSETA